MKKSIAFLFIFLASVSLFAQDLAALHDKLIRFYGYQRAGLKNGTSGNLNGMNAHGGDNYNNNPLDGGWYDAGDYIKFGMPLGYTVYSLLKGYDIFPSQYTDNYKSENSNGADGIPDILNQVRYATDYLTKAVISDNLIICDVGQAQPEHDADWNSIPNSGGRSGGQVFPCTGADIPAVYAACLALMSVLYKKYDSTYAALCLTKAISAFKFAKNKIAQGGDKNLYCDAQKDNSGNYFYYYYNSQDKGLQRQIADKMVAAGVELYRATNGADPTYKSWAMRPIAENYNVMCYSFIGPLAAFEVWRQGLGSYSSINQNAGFAGNAIKTSGFFTGVYQNAGWGTARDIGAAAFTNALAYIVNSTKIQRDTMLNRTKNHVAWVTGYFGQTKRSYIVQFNGGPTNIHYRPTRSGPPGGLVSGPDGDGRWDDNGGANYTEVALDYNAGITGAVAFLKAINSTGGSDVKISTPFSVNPSSNVDFGKQSVTFSAAFSKSITWTLRIAGGFGSKTITKTGASINETWDGSADKGFFLSGETVTAQLSIDGTIVAFDIVNAKALEIYILKAKKVQTTESDVLVDDFDDNDTINKLGGHWIGFGNEVSFAGKTQVTFDTMNNSKALKAVCNVTKENPPFIYAGVKSTFNSAGTPRPIGDAKSIVFDMRGGNKANVRVELVQSTIMDSAYWGIDVPITALPNTYRVNIEDFKQPDWKTVDKPLDRNTITAIRFTIYDSTSRIEMYVDNVSVEDLSSSAVICPPGQVQSSLKPVVMNGALRYQMPPHPISAVSITICDVVGRVVMKRTIQANPGEIYAVSFTHLPAGVFTVEHAVNGAGVGRKIKFTHVR